MEQTLIDLSSSIVYWEGQISNSFEHYDLAFFKIYIKLELFIIELFKEYSLGNSSSSGYTPERKLSFQDSSHLDNIFCNRRTSYIEYIEIIKTKSKFVFATNKDPFSLIFSDANLSNYINQFKILRNYIAHESVEAKRNYQRTILGNGSFISVNDHLRRRNRRRSISYFSLYIEKIEDIKEILLNPTPYF
jgi:hypothetical protein